MIKIPTQDEDMIEQLIYSKKKAVQSFFKAKILHIATKCNLQIMATTHLSPLIGIIV